MSKTKAITCEVHTIAHHASCPSIVSSPYLPLAQVQTSCNQVICGLMLIGNSAMLCARIHVNQSVGDCVVVGIVEMFSLCETNVHTFDMKADVI